AGLADEQDPAHVAAYVGGLIGARAQPARGRVDLSEELLLDPVDRERSAGGACDRDVDVISADARELLGACGGAEAAGQLGCEDRGVDGQVWIRSERNLAKLGKGRGE